MPNELSFPTLDKIIEKLEGFYPGSRSYRNNNPGNLKFGPFAQEHGATGKDSEGFAVFPDYLTGMTAQDELIQGYANSGHSLEDMIADWNGNGPNTGSYQSDAAKALGVPGSTKLWDLLKNNPFLKTPESPSEGGTDTPGVGSFFGISWTRFAAFLIGILCIGAGLLMFKPTQDVIVQTKDAVSKAALSAA
jgi:hypothetical protein